MISKNSKSNKILETIFENTHILIAYLDRDLCFQRVNKAYAEADQKETDYFVGKKHFDLYPNSENEVIFQQVLDNGVAHNCYAKPFEYQFNPERGITHWDWSLVPIRDENNLISGLILQLLNVTARIEAEEKLAFQEKLGNAFVESTTALMIALDQSGQIIRFNRACEKATQYQSTEVLNQYVWDLLLVPEEIDSVKSIFQNLTKSALPSEYTNHWLAKDGSKRLIHWSNSTLKDKSDHVQYVISVGIDVTDLMKTQNELKRSEEKLLEAQSVAKIGTWDWEIANNKLYWSDEVFRIFGVTNDPSEKIFYNTYESFLDQVHPDDRTKVKLAVDASLESPENSYQVEHRVLLKNGQIRYVEETGKVDFHDNKPVRMLGVVQDITQRHLIEREIKQFKYTLDQTLDCVFMFDAKHLQFNYVNEGAMRQVGYSENELLTMHPFDINPDRSETEYRKMIQPLVQGELPALNFEAMHRNKKGQLIPVEILLQYIEMQDMHAKFVAVVRDTSERQQTNQQLKRQATIIDQIHDSVVSTDLEGFVTSWNKGAEKIFGFTADEMISKHISEVYPKDSHEFLKNEVIAPLRAKGQHEIEVIMLKKSGEEFYAYLSLSMQYDDKGNAIGMIGYTMDITDRKNAENKLRETSQLLDSIVENVPNMIFLKRASDLRFEFFNSAGETMLGLNRSELLGRNDYDFFPKEQADFFTTKDREVLAKSNIVDIPEETIETSNGSLTLHTQKITLRDDSGRPIYLLGISEDISERKKNEIEIDKYRHHLEELVDQRTSELQIARDEAEQANKAKSEFLSRMSHELRTPLNAILGFGQLLTATNDRTLSKMDADSVVEIQQAGQHLLALVNDILDLSGIEAGQMNLQLKNTALNPIITACVSQLQPLAVKKGIQIVFDKNNNCFVYADETRLKQVLINLLSNAIKYNRENGSIHLYCKQVDNDLKVHVQDTGLGIIESDISRLFQPFGRLISPQEEIEGTGIGLVLAKKLTEVMGGKIGVESEVGTGSIFWFQLPMSRKTTDQNETKDKISSIIPEGNHNAQRKILYIEDNPANMRLVEKIIAMRDNLILIEATNAEEGLVSAMQQQPDLILLDLNLPDMNGFEAVHQLKAMPQTETIPVIAITANAMQHDIENGKAAGFDEYITKPFDLNEFFEKIDRVMVTVSIKK